MRLRHVTSVLALLLMSSLIILFALSPACLAGVRWTTDGVGVRSQPETAGDAFSPQIAQDGSGGAIITWEDNRSGSKDDIYAQKVDASGNRLWTTDGVGVRSQPTTAGDAGYPQIAPDGSGGAIITWQDNRSGSKYDIYAQRVDASGNRLWTTDGVGVRSQPTTLNGAYSPQIAPDGSGGAIITWEDYRSGINYDGPPPPGPGPAYDIYAQRVDASGNRLWTTDGVGVRSQPTTLNGAQDPQIAPDGTGGAIITWDDRRSGPWYVYAQRVDASGNPLWTTDGVGVRSQPTTAGHAFLPQMPLLFPQTPQITPDGTGGAIITWQDYRSWSKYDVYAQRVDASGKCLWTTDGVGVRSQPTTLNGAYSPQIAPDGTGGAIITWHDFRSDKGDIYAQRVDASGKCLWTTDGVGVRSQPTTAGNAWHRQIQIAPDGTGGAIIAWQDQRSGSKNDIYAQRISNPVFYFAEGTSRPGFDPYLCIQNPGESDAAVTITYMKGDGTTDTQELTVGKNSRSTVAVKNKLGEGDDVSHDFSCKVESTNGVPIIAERPMYFNYKGWTGGHDVMGALTPASSFYFAEGTCRPGFDPYLCIQNPGGSTASVILTYMKGDGTTASQSISVPANSRSTVHPADVLGESNDASHDFSTKVECNNGQQIIAERPMYFNYKGWTGGHDVMGALTPASSFYFAEGTCRPGFDPYLCIQNPGESDADVTITYMKGDGNTDTQDLAVGKNSRSTVAVKNKLGQGDDPAHDFSCKVESTNGVAIIAERPMYFNYKGRTGGHDVVGALSPASSFYFAEGTCRPGFDPYFCIQNPGGTDASVTITYMKGDGTTDTQDINVPKNSRVTVAARDKLGTGDDAAHDFSSKVECTNGQAIIAERPMYFNYKGIWTGGHDVVGFAP